MEHYELIRRKIVIEGKSQRDVAKELGHSCKTIAKVLELRIPPGYRLSKLRPSPVIEPVRHIIDTWLEQNKHTRPKQRQTGRRIYERLRDEYGFKSHYGTVQRYIRQAANRQKEVFMPQQFEPGEEAQVDWHEGWVFDNGVERKYQFFSMKLCYSKATFVYPYERADLESFLDGHRVAFNRAFAKKGLNIEWDIPLYGELLKVAGGKERMRHYFNTTQWPAGVTDKDAYIRELHKLKTDCYMQVIDSGQLPLRPGVARLVDEAIAAHITLAVCSTSNERAVKMVIERMLGPERKSRFAAILAGDVVSMKKPDPEIYNLALGKLDLQPQECVVIEDSRNGLVAAKSAGMTCVITTNGYTENEDFSEADLVVSELGDKPHVQVTLEKIRNLVENN